MRRFNLRQTTFTGAFYVPGGERLWHFLVLIGQPIAVRMALTYGRVSRRAPPKLDAHTLFNKLLGLTLFSARGSGRRQHACVDATNS